MQMGLKDQEETEPLPSPRSGCEGGREEDANDNRKTWEMLGAGPWCWPEITGQLVPGEIARSGEGEDRTSCR